MGVVKNIMVRAIADFSDLITGSRRASDAMRNMSERMGGATAGLAGGLGGVAMKLAALAGIYISFDYLKDATADAIKFDASMETLNNRMGASAIVFNQWAATTGKAMGYSKTQIAEYGNTFSNMLYDAATDQEDLANKTAKFLEASAIVRSKTGLSQEEVSKRMRSAMNMEADGADELGVNVRATAVEQSKAFKELAGGVKNYSDLSSGVQKNIMYTYLLDEVTRRYGSTVSGNAATQTAKFVASLKDLSLSIGQAFLPIWTTVVPALTDMISWLDRAVSKVAVFMRVMFGYSATDTTKSAQDSTQAFKGQTAAVDSLTDAHKKLAKAKAGVAGFDQVNTLPDKADADAAAAGVAAGTGADKPKTATAASNARNQPVMDDVDGQTGAEGFANRVKKAFQDVQAEWQKLQDAFKGQSPMVIALESIGAAILLYFGAGALAAVATFAAGMATALVTEAIPALYEFAVAQSAAFWEITLAIVVIAAIIAVIIVLATRWKEVWAVMKEVGAWIKEFFGNLATWFKDNVIDPFITGWNGAWSSFGTGVKGAWTTLTDEFKGAAKWFYDNVIKPIVDFFVQFAIDVGTGSGKVWDAMSGAFSTAGTWFKTNVVDTIITKFGNLKEGAKTAATDAWTEIKNVFSTVESWFGTNIVTPIKTAFAGIATGLGNGVVTAFKSVYNTVAGYLNGMIKAWNGITGSNPLTKGLSIGFELPMLAKGGITNGPMAAIIGDNAGGREVVSPLSDLQGHIATAVIQALAFSGAGSKSNAPQGDIVLNIDGRQLARITKPYFDDENGRSGNIMITTI